MINNPDWQEPKIKPYHYQLSLDCIEKLVDCIGQFNKDKLDCDNAFKMQKQILTDEIDDPEFLEYAIENFSEMMGYIATGNLNIRIHRDITGEMWFVAIFERKLILDSLCTTKNVSSIILYGFNNL